MTATAVAAAASSVQRERHAAHVDAERRGGRVAAREQRRIAREEQRDDQHARRARASARSPCAATDRSPISQNSMPRTCVSGASGEHQHDERAEARRDHDAGEQQARRRPRAAAAREPEHQQRRQPRAGERGGRRERREAEQQRGERAARSAARKAEHVRIGERIAQQHLHQRSRRPRARPPTANAAIARGRRSSRTTDAAGVVAVAEQRVRRRRRRDVDAADRERDAPSRRSPSRRALAITGSRSEGGARATDYNFPSR